MKEYCEICGSEMAVSLAFSGKTNRPSARETYKCSCGYATIKETIMEMQIRKGKFDEL